MLFRSVVVAVVDVAAVVAVDVVVDVGVWVRVCQGVRQLP